MSNSSTAKFEARARIIKAMAHWVRLLIVDRLARQGPACVCELAQLAGCDVSTVSRHLNQLRQAGIVLGEKRGQQVFYQLRSDCVLKFLECVEAMLRSNLRREQGLVRTGPPGMSMSFDAEQAGEHTTGEHP